jgi:hypothetical protein
MSTDDRWKRLLNAAGIETGRNSTSARVEAQITSTLSSLFAAINQQSTSPMPLNDFSSIVTNDSVAGHQQYLLNDNIVHLTKQLFDLRQSTEQHTVSMDNNTVVTQENTAARAQSGFASAAGLGRTVAGIGSGLTLSPLISGLSKLFRNTTSTSEREPLPLYSPSAPVRIDGTISGRSQMIEEVSYGQAGLPRRSGGEHVNEFPPVTIQVNAIDSRSFLDHSESIARAVREAMLTMHAINDVVSDL